jgi:tRNA-dihydrouridine synthase
MARYLETGRRERSPPLATQFTLIAALYDEMLSHHGLRIGLKHARKHLGWALDAAASSAGITLDTLRRWRTNVLTCETPAEVQVRLARAYNAFATGAAA